MSFNDLFLQLLLNVLVNRKLSAYFTAVNGLWKCTWRILNSFGKTMQHSTYLEFKNGYIEKDVILKNIQRKRRWSKTSEKLADCEMIL